MNRKKILITLVLCFAFVLIATKVYATLTLNATTITSDGALTLAPATNVIVNGNLGIGTDNPSALLQVAQPAAGSGLVSVSAGSTIVTVTGIDPELTPIKIGDQITFITSSGSETRDITGVTRDDESSVITSIATTPFTGSASNVPYTIRQNQLSVLSGGDIYTNGSLFPSYGHLFLRTNPNNYSSTLSNSETGFQPALTFQDLTSDGQSMGFHFITDGTDPGTRMEAKGRQFDNIIFTWNQLGNVGIGTASPNANAILDVSSTTKAFMPPRMTTAQRDLIPSPTEGMVIYNSTTHKLNVFTTTWEQVTSS